MCRRVDCRYRSLNATRAETTGLHTVITVGDAHTAARMSNANMDATSYK